MAVSLPGSAQDEPPTPRLTSATRTIAVTGEGYFPVLVLLRDGRLAAVIRGGAPHLGRGGRLDWIESRDGGKTWSAPRTIVDGPWDDRNPALGQMRDGTLVLAYWECHCYDAKGNWAPSMPGSAMVYVLSRDGGKTWSERQPLDSGPFCPQKCSPYGRIVQLADGTAVMAIYGRPDPKLAASYHIEDTERDAAGILRSRDNGKTWGDFSLVWDGGFSEAALLPVGARKLFAAVRTEPDGLVDVRTSEDGGRKWHPGLPATGGMHRRLMQHPADLVRLKNGHILMVFGNRVPPYGVGALLSLDGGKTWSGRHSVQLAWTSANTDTGYPSAVRLPDGTIVCLYYAVGTEELPNVAQAICVRFTEAELEAACRR